jgi:hypothetical protein
MTEERSTLTIEPIKIVSDAARGGEAIDLAKAYLGTSSCLVWVGFGFDTTDNDDERVRRTRELMARFYPNVPYGMGVGNPDEQGRFLIPLVDANQDGYYELDVSRWPAGVYRFNYHSLPNESSPQGGPLSSQRDGEVSWAWWGADRHPDAVQTVRPIVHKERNGAGYCFRILIRTDRSIEPFGNLDTDRELSGVATSPR